MPLTPAQKKAAERERKRADGLRPLEVWAKPEHHAQIRAYVERLSRAKPRNRLSQHV